MSSYFTKLLAKANKSFCFDDNFGSKHRLATHYNHHFRERNLLSVRPGVE